MTRNRKIDSLFILSIILISSILIVSRMNTIKPSVMATIGSIDPAIYLTSAIALADGSGYVDCALHDKKPITHFPPGFPIVIAAVIGPGFTFPEKINHINFIGIISAILGLVFLYFFIQQQYKEVSKIGALALVSLTGLSPYTIQYSSQLIMSEMSFWMITLLSLIIVSQLISTKTCKASYKWILLFALAISTTISFYIRTVGLTLILSTIVYLLLRKKFPEVILYFALISLFLFPWVYRNVSLGHSPFHTDYSKAFLWKEFAKPEYGYIENYWEVAERIVNNIVDHLRTSIPWIYIPSLRPNGILFRFENVLGLPFTFFVGVTLTFIALIGYFSKIKERIDILEIYIITYIFFILLPPWTTDRNFVPIISFLFLYLILGIHVLLRFFPNNRVQKYAIYPVLALFLFINIGTSRHQVIEAIQVGFNQESLQESKASAELISWIHNNTKIEDVIYSVHPYGLYLFTRREGVLLSYSNDINTIWEEIISSDANYIIPSLDGKVAGNNLLMGELVSVEKLFKEYHDSFSLVFKSPTDSRIRVYKINR